jgi:AraC family ethanolamine operon transcriptional activator
LQNSFREVADTTPVHYIRCLRLDAVRRQLLSTPNPPSITEAAMSRGFTHLSHFTEQYRSLFGELPSETLHGRKTS